LRVPLNFYSSEDVVSISKALLGKVLCTNIDGAYTSGVIVETEAYHGPEDKASHAFGMRRTARTEPMFGRAGVTYIYLCYGIHHLFIIVTAPTGTPHAILVRAVEPLDGIDIMLRRRGMQTLQPRLTSGPGSMSAALGLTTALSGQDLQKRNSPVWIEDGKVLSRSDVIASPRVGVAYAAEWAEKPWRFRIRENRWTSPAK
jgi:DNA-3-methyladenine glycosylase